MNTWSGDLDNIPQIGELFYFDNKLFEMTTCPCKCGGVWVKDYMSQEDDIALSFLMRKDIGDPDAKALVYILRKFAANSCQGETVHTYHMFRQHNLAIWS